MTGETMLYADCYISYLSLEIAQIVLLFSQLM